ncbi:MAG: Asp-tRNA(Asn)/Glu-tRNA(Gln) amidotransferase subunit GatB [Propionibacteriaceae bacterium]|jgi:aspartyl-tRNA(Asn)/glutamyl-tRNA(Gln) amidotransferase subunit B|nr:Asp-tRNA(Asn)/Glu-tRNA(Gln) amidotransferase subunit GatB [Propionibacteriaceae bacterium]
MSYEELMDYDEVMESYDPALGLEVHVELNTHSKMFCSCSTQFGAEPNTQTCPTCLGLPGSLPVVNAKAIESAIRIGLALNCSISTWCRFARKNYFYPDMTKNFQTSQYDEPICFDGQVEVEVDGQPFIIPIERAHMEEDAGKSQHMGGTTGRIQGADYSLMDYNRAGVPLIEIVTKPIMATGPQAPAVARAYVGFLRDMIRALGVSDVRMEQGSLRCDANVSLMPKGSTTLGTRTETKNVNSLRSIEKALRFEICRQGAILSSGGQVVQETRHWHEDGAYTSAGRSKEEAEDYRYFPEPDLVPIAPSREWVEELRATIPEPPAVHIAGLNKTWGFSDLEMRDVVNAEAVDLIHATVEAGASPQAARKWWMTELLRRANAESISLEDLPISGEHVAEVQRLIDSGLISDKIARQVIEAVLAGEGSPTQIVEDRGLTLVSDSVTLQKAVDDVIEANPDIAQKIREGKDQATGALIGQVMKQMSGQADAAKVREMIIASLAS